ncbi:MAG: apolipoprotein N-acyltransferase, partial [Acidobacteriota bacterium]
LPLGAWIGVWGVSYLVVFANGAVAWAVRRRRWAPAAIGLLVPLLLLALAGRFAGPAGSAAGAPERTATPVRIVQPAIYNQVEYDPQVTRESYARLIRMTDDACDRPGALIVWPESAAWPYELERDPLLARDVERFARRGCPVLLNSTHRVQPVDPGGASDDLYYNSAYLVRASPRGIERARYDKRHLVPFGEYVPLAGVFSFLDHLARNAGAYTPAEAVTLLPLPDTGESLGTAICFEVTFPAEVAELARAGATVLVTVTNDAWYGDSAAPRQHFRAARWRAAETGRPLLRAAITGISAVVGPDGSVRASLGVGAAGILRARIAGRTGRTPFVRAPWAVPGAAAVLAAFAIIIAARRRVR